jgi:hypothetical protein
MRRHAWRFSAQRKIGLVHGGVGFASCPAAEKPAAVTCGLEVLNPKGFSMETAGFATRAHNQSISFYLDRSHGQSTLLAGGKAKRGAGVIPIQAELGEIPSHKRTSSALALPSPAECIFPLPFDSLPQNTFPFD